MPESAIVDISVLIALERIDLLHLLCRAHDETDALYGGNNMTSQMERIEIDLPKDIVFAMHGIEKPEEIKKKLKTALAILLFQERTISLGKAVELSEMSRVRFIELLEEYGLPAYDYGQQDIERDRRIIVEYRETTAE